ncbi:tetratricopeptide repeat protein [Sediminivirga luteola]|jgi:putative thioredoxin|uniref:Co-chaperone YbbN n=1 Tax=Sediminivirga luteola TaxID=1774748 RepID=A0A8J2XFE3_9MICO|nr:tetratricopeptide repeat protein [Sediminivirga luteola]MCI2266314.1 tetratricopeptide repeat protein [Sediminivirga luteola]GGA12553.1 co-chaperone YbbN [Sediminivirga luteola]
MTSPFAPEPEQPRTEGIDLSAARSVPREPGADAAVPGTAAAQPGPGEVAVPALVMDVTEETFNAVVELSAEVPVVIDLWADWCAPCKQLSPILERVVESHGGKVILAKVDIEANPRLQQLFQAQSIPTVVAIVKGQPVPLFQGALPEPQVKQYFDELLKLAAANGVNGRAVVAGGQEQGEPAQTVKHPEALDALERGDLDAAEAAYSAALKEAPADEEARVGLARTGLLKRVRGLSLDEARKAAADDPGSVDAQLAVADLDVAGGHVEDAYARLIELIRRTAGEERDRVRLRLLDLFEVVGSEDPRTVRARSQLMRALF